jgi:hypothetical protein
MGCATSVPVDDGDRERVLAVPPTVAVTDKPLLSNISVAGSKKELGPNTPPETPPRTLYSRKKKLKKDARCDRGDVCPMCRSAPRGRPPV